MQRNPHIIGYRKSGAPIYAIAGGAITALWYGNAFITAFDKKIDLNSDVNKVALATSTYAVDQDAHDFFNDVTNEVSGTGYTAGGNTLAYTSVSGGTQAGSSTYTGATNVWNFDADDTTWTTATITARFAVVYDSSPGTAATNPLISYVNFGADQSSSGADFKIVWDPAGIVKVTVS